MRKILPLLWIPLGYFVGTILGEIIYSALGYEVGTTNAPTWVKVLSSMPALVLVILGFIMAYRRGRKNYK
jgi:uncharacterized membrane protein YdjX (TVP38/TMEM64 family)